MPETGAPALENNRRSPLAAAPVALHASPIDGTFSNRVLRDTYLLWLRIKATTSDANYSTIPSGLGVSFFGLPKPPRVLH